MKLKFPLALAGTALCINALAQVKGATAPYNEAVRVIDGKRLVEMPPHTKSDDLVAQSVTTPASHPGLSTTVRVVETPMGLMDCDTVSFYHPHACSPSTYGVTKAPREWVVKLNGHWQACLGRAKPVACIPLNGDGVLRALPPATME